MKISIRITLIILFGLTACSPSFNDKEIEQTPLFVESEEATHEVDETLPSPTETLEAKVTAVATSEINPTKEVTSFPTSTPEPSLMVQDECPTQVEPDSQPIWSEGSILFGTGKLIQFDYPYPYDTQLPGIWAISDNSLEPKLAYEIPSGTSSWVIVSNDGSTLLRFEFTNEDRTEGNTIFYNLTDQVEISVEGSSKVAWDFEWLPNGEVKILTNEERTFGEGIRREFVLVNPTTMQSEVITEEFSLPGYMVNDEVVPGGYASISPRGNLVLYTAFADGVEIRLQDINTGNIIWRKESTFLPGPPAPIWTNDGNHVLFYVGDSKAEEQFSYNKLIYLSNRGEEEELPFQPYPSMDKGLSFLTLSPNQQFIIYGRKSAKGVGYVLDTSIWKVGEICDSDATFFGGQWMSENLFVYLALVEREGQTAYSLRVLDISRWEYQEVFESAPGYGINLFSWTPIEFN